MSTAAQETLTLTALLRLHLPADVLDNYQAQAAARGIPLEQLLSDRLIGAVDGADRRAFLNDAQRRELEILFGKNFTSSVDLVNAIKSLAAVKIEDITVQLSPEMLRRLRSRAIYKSNDFDKWLQDLIRAQLQMYLQMN